jgi:Leucine-rich repeat (LRR) protein
MTTQKFIKKLFVRAIIAGICILYSSRSYSQSESKFDTILSVSTAQFRSSNIPDSIFQMTHLRHLTISGMDCDYSPHPNCWMINEIPAKIGNLTDLISLKLTLTSISAMPYEVIELKNLILLDLTDGSLSNSNLDNITRITSLEYLYLYGCRLSKLPADISHLINLKELGLTGNNFDSAEQAGIRKLLPHCIVKF